MTIKEAVRAAMTEWLNDHNENGAATNDDAQAWSDHATQLLEEALDEWCVEHGFDTSNAEGQY